MDTDINTVKLLGVGQVLVIISYFITEGLLESAAGSGSISDMLVNISKKLTLARIGNLAALGQTLVIIATGVLYYVVFFNDYQIIALVALGCFLIAAIFIAVGKIGSYGLIPLSQEFVKAGAPEPSHFQALGNFLYYGVGRRGHDLYALFIYVGFMLTNYLLYKSEYIPRSISIFGLVSISLILIYQVLQVYDREFLPRAIILAVPYVPY